MQNDGYAYLQKDPKLVEFVRRNPIWYRYLSRDNACLDQLKKEADLYYGKTLPQRLERVHNQLQMLTMFIRMAGDMKD